MSTYITETKVLGYLLFRPYNLEPGDINIYFELYYA